MQMKTAFIIPLMVLSLGGSLAAQTSAPALDTTTFIVMGEGLAAGMANYGLSSVMQTRNFASLVATQMGAAFEQPLIQPPGIADVIGLPGQEPRMQAYPQGSVRQFYLPTDKTKDPIKAPPLFVQNLSVPGLTLADSVTIRPLSPIVHKRMKQTVFNLILGFPQLIFANVPLWTQLEYAENMFPTISMVELGYYEALDAAVNGDPTRMPDPVAFGTTYNQVVAGLRGTQSQVVVTTIPNPIDTAYFNSTAAAAVVCQTTPAVLTALYHPSTGDYFTRNGLQVIANQLATGVVGPLASDSTMSAATAADITSRVNALNAQIVSAAQKNGAFVYDLNAFMHKIKVSGATAGTTSVSGDYLGGFYSLDGVYPSFTGNALIANDIVAFLNSTYHKTFPLVDVAAVAANDPSTHNYKPQGALYTPASLGLSQR